MPIPKRNPDEDRTDFLSRCMSNPKMNEEYPDSSQRYAVCQQSVKSTLIQAVSDVYYDSTFGSEELVFNESQMYIPSDDEYVDFGEETEEYIVLAKPGLWENIRKKKERQGKNYKPSKKGDPNRPSKEAWKQAQSDWHSFIKSEILRSPVSSKAEYEDGQMQREQLMKMHEQLMEIVEYMDNVEFEDWTKDMISKSEIYIQNVYDFIEARVDENEESYAADKPKVKLNKPFRTPKGPKKFSVYVKNDKGNIVKVNFGDPNMDIKRDDPQRRKNFRARHQCDTNPGPKWKARYWSCRFWEAKKSVTDLT